MKELNDLRTKQAEAERCAYDQPDSELKTAMEDIAQGWRDLADERQAMLEGRARITADNDAEIEPSAAANR